MNVVEPTPELAMAPLTNDMEVVEASGTPKEVGQEALWVEEDQSIVSPGSTVVASPKAAARGFFKKAATGAENSNSKRKMFRRKKVKQGHSVLVDHPVNQNAVAAEDEKPDLTAAESTQSSDIDPQIRVITGKAVAARAMLDQALAGSDDSPEKLVKTAFSEAVAARLMADPGSSESNLSQYKKLQAQGEKLASEAILAASSSKAGVEDAEAAAARAVLDELLPVMDEAQDAEAEPATEEAGAISTVLSMSSLNEILDGPEPEKTPKNTASGKKKSLKLFGKKAARNDPEGATPVPATNATPAEKKSPIRLFTGGTKGAVERFAPTVITNDGTKKELEREISNIGELDQIKGLDAETEDLLKEALMSDDTESLSSYDGVKLFGGNPTKTKNKKKKDGEKVDNPIPKSAPRSLAANQPTFISVPQGRADILTQKSWDSLMEQDAVDPMDAPNARFDSRQRFTSESPASNVAGIKHDKYATFEEPASDPAAEEPTGVDDKYAVVPEGDDEATGLDCGALCGIAGSNPKTEASAKHGQNTSRSAPPALVDEISTFKSEAPETDRKETKPKKKLFGGLFKRSGKKSKSAQTPISTKSVPEGLVTESGSPELRQVVSDSDVEKLEAVSGFQDGEAESSPPPSQETPENIPRDDDSASLGIPSDLTREQTIEKTAIETSWREVPSGKASSPRDPLIARLRGKKNKKSRRAVDP